MKELKAVKRERIRKNSRKMVVSGRGIFAVLRMKVIKAHEARKISM